MPPQISLNQSEVLCISGGEKNGEKYHKITKAIILSNF